MKDEQRDRGEGALAPLKDTTFRAIWLASIASNFGGLIQSVAAAWLMTSISRSADMVALIQASTSLPIMLFSLAAGAIADNFNRRQVMLVAQSFMLVVSALLTLCAYLGLITPWLRGGIRRECIELSAADLCGGAMETGSSGKDAAARAVGNGNYSRAALCRHVAQYREGAVAQLPVRPPPFSSRR